MSKIVKYVALIEENTGRILNVEFPQASLKEEGIESGLRTVHITEELMPQDFMSQGMNLAEWVWLVDKFVHVGKPPNRHATYTGTEWTWDAEALLNDVRMIRNQKLAVTDWTMMPDAQLEESEKQAYITYRQSLRDFMATVGDISSIEELEFPVKP